MKDSQKFRSFKIESPESIQNKVLDIFSYHGERQKIEYRTNEFSAVCPFSGLPDIGQIMIEYIPYKKILELKSLKLYFISFRNVGIYQEEVTDRIFKDIAEILEPCSLKITTVYNTRGGIDATCQMEKRWKRK